MQDIVIELRDVSKIYKLYQQPIDRLKEVISKGKKIYHKDFRALNQLTLQVRKGETIGIVGKNGSGKSTLLKIVTDVLKPTTGTVKVDGRISALLELGAGFNMEYTGIENIYQNGMVLGFTNEEMECKLPEIIKFADIGDFLYQPVKTYSSGMLVRLAFSVAISVDPDILIVDEALAVGDTRFQLKCMNKFADLQKKGVTILFVSHDINSVKRFCNQTVWIDQGSLIQIGNTEEVCENYLDHLKKEAATPLDHIIQKKLLQENDAETMKALESIDIASIEKIRLLDETGNETDIVNFNSSISVEVYYLVKEKNIINPVIGIAIYSIDNEYICGLNTLLDNFKIKWNIGRNTCCLVYDKFNLIGGSYYLDVAIYDQTATVRIDYQTRIKDFFVKEKYLGEGKVILTHNWK